jgi:uncharacterized protein YjbI with pentapeptide repeats
MVDRAPQPADDDNTKARQRRRLVWRLAGAGLLVLGLLVVLLLACVLWIPKWLYPPLTGTDLRGVSDAAKVHELRGARLKLQNDARTTLLQGLGAVLVLTGAGIGASVTLRQIRETATANRNQLKLSEQGQVNERYTKAVEQLGHNKAPVRLGALHSLERLAQDNLDLRPLVVDVVCAYLRMPYTPPTPDEPATGPVAAAVKAASTNPDPEQREQEQERDAAQELQVRKTAQHILADHLRRPPQTSGQEAQLLPSPQQAFWPGISLDLTGATLVDVDFTGVSVVQALFVRATFQHSARFNEATFQDDALFGGATFQDDAWFDMATFHRRAVFIRATFQGGARFGARFGGATFLGDAWFAEATFQSDAEFGEARFQAGARFDRATFHRSADFLSATFQDYPEFRPEFREAHVEHLDNPDLARVWPDGWAIRPNPADPTHPAPTRGTLVPAEQAREPEPAVPPPGPTADNGSWTG